MNFVVELMYHQMLIKVKCIATDDIGKTFIHECIPSLKLLILLNLRNLIATNIDKTIVIFACINCLLFHNVYNVNK